MLLLQPTGHPPRHSGKRGAGNSVPSHSYEGCIVYTSFDPATDQGRKYRVWGYELAESTARGDGQVPGATTKIGPKVPAVPQGDNALPSLRRENEGQHREGR